MFRLAEDQRRCCEKFVIGEVFKVDWVFSFACAAYNLVRRRNLNKICDPIRLTRGGRGFNVSTMCLLLHIRSFVFSPTGNPLFRIAQLQRSTPVQRIGWVGHQGQPNRTFIRLGRWLVIWRCELNYRTRVSNSSYTEDMSLSVVGVISATAKKSFQRIKLRRRAISATSEGSL